MYTLVGIYGDAIGELRYHVLGTAKSDETLIEFVNDNIGNGRYDWIFNENMKLDRDEFTGSGLYHYTNYGLNSGPLREYVAFEIWAVRQFRAAKR